MILLTTSDYLPQIGGLTTFTQNIESVLIDLKLDYKLLHWKSFQEIGKISEAELEKYRLIINIHPQFAWLSATHQERMINFIHGSEILMTSPDFIKKIYKKISKKNYYNKLQSSHLNVFISEATLNKARGKGYVTDYSRDIILHNCIPVEDAQFVKKEIKNQFTFSCIVRNVPHKNLLGSVKFCEIVSELTGRAVELIVPLHSNLKSSVIKIHELSGSSNQERDEAFKKSHFNLLLSSDHSHKGFFEGFGLTVLEAGRFGTPSIVMNTGGLSEAVHHGETGWVIDNISNEVVRRLFSRENILKYDQLALDCFRHTLRSHSLNEYKKLLQTLSELRGVA